jgi:hypothetical protein
VLVIFAALSFEALRLVRLRASPSRDETRLWIDLVPGLSVVLVVSLCVLLLSGIYLTLQLDAGTAAWPKVAVLSIMLIGPLGAITGRRMRIIRRMSGDTTISESDLTSQLRDRFFDFSLSTRIAVFVRMLFLMSAKPGLGESLSIIGASIVVGLACVAVTPRRETPPWAGRWGSQA